MNERIKQLSLQATKKISFRLDPNTYKHIDDPEGDLERFEFDKEKFAELIVRECADVIRKEVSLKYKDGGETEEFMGGHYASSMLARVKIKNHFGVEE